MRTLLFISMLALAGTGCSGLHIGEDGSTERGRGGDDDGGRGGDDDGGRGGDDDGGRGGDDGGGRGGDDGGGRGGDDGGGRGGDDGGGRGGDDGGGRGGDDGGGRGGDDTDDPSRGGGRGDEGDPSDDATYDDCDHCSDDEACVSFSIRASDFEVCAGSCYGDSECSEGSSGDATPTCVGATRSPGDCVLSCSDGETCPDGMTCAPYGSDRICAWAG